MFTIDTTVTIRNSRGTEVTLCLLEKLDEDLVVLPQRISLSLLALQSKGAVDRAVALLLKHVQVLRLAPEPQGHRFVKEPEDKSKVLVASEHHLLRLVAARLAGMPPLARHATAELPQLFAKELELRSDW